VSDTHACTGPVVRTLTALESQADRHFPVLGEPLTTRAAGVVTAATLHVSAVKLQILQFFMGCVQNTESGFPFLCAFSRTIYVHFPCLSWHHKPFV